MTQTGPRSPRAKARVSRNAVRHGLRSTKVVIPGLELQKDWDHFFNDSIVALSPVGAIEYALVDRITTLIWRLRRAARAERDSAILAGKLVEERGDPLLRSVSRLIVGFHHQLGFTQPDGSPVEPPRPEGAQTPRAPVVLPVPLQLQNLSKYEYRLSRQLLHTMHELWALQDRRRGGATPLALDEGPNDA